MNYTFGKLVFGGLLSAVVLTAPLGATSIGAGSFNLQGTLDVTATSVLFGLNSTPPPGDQLARVQPPLLGVFGSGALALTTGSSATIHNITSQPSFPSGALSIPQWVVLPDGVDLDLVTVPFNQSIAACTGTTADNTIGNSCRPNALSPIVLTETSTGVTANLNVMGVAYTGTAGSGTTPFSGLISADFSSLLPGEGTISTLLGTFASQGFITTGYTSNFSTTPVPEPSMLAAMGFGVLLLGAWRRKRQADKQD